MEIIEAQTDEVVGEAQVAYADTWEETALLRGLLSERGIPSLAREVRGRGISGGIRSYGPQRIYVPAEQAAAARKLIGETMVEEPPEEIPEPVNARYLSESGLGDGESPPGRARDYSAVGAIARFYFVALVVFALAVGIFFALH